MIWNIVVDSSCDLGKLHYLDEKNEVRYSRSMKQKVYAASAQSAMD